MTMQLDYRDKCVFVTDSTSGLGRRMAERFHALGATVAINGISADTVQRAIEEMGGGPRLISAPADLTRISRDSINRGARYRDNDPARRAGLQLGSGRPPAHRRCH